MKILLLLCIILCINCIKYKDLSYDEIISIIDSLKLDNSSNIIRVYNSFETFNIPKSSNGNIKCSPDIIRITDFSTLDYDTSRPQLLISGEIHGDERIGPVASVVLAQILTYSAMCDFNNNEYYCDKLNSNEYLISDYDRIWLSHLVKTRDIFIVPTANCIGYITNRRNDETIDPNRDFSYGRTNNKCFLSHTSQLFYYLSNYLTIQLLLTFHGGMVALGYEWGSINHLNPKDKSPDDNTNRDIANLMKEYAGSFKNEKSYQYAPINSIVYPVEGGMEDWFYAAGWDNKTNRNDCIGYQYINKTLTNHNRAIVYLIETSNHKRPIDNSYGGSISLLNNKHLLSEDGHIPRNVRLALAGIEMIQPYICFQSIKLYNNITNSNDIIINQSNLLDIQWYIGGSNYIDKTFLTWQYINNTNNIDTNNNSNIKISKLFSNKLYQNVFDYKYKSKIRRLSSIGLSFLASTICLSYNNNSYNNFSINQLNYCYSNQNNKNISNIYKYKSNIYNYKSIITSPKNIIMDNQLNYSYYYLTAWAMVDRRWLNSQQGYPMSYSPQSYLANLRTNHSFSFTLPSNILTSQRHLSGRLLWPSHSVVIKVYSNGNMSIYKSITYCNTWNNTII